MGDEAGVYGVDSVDSIAADSRPCPVCHSSMERHLVDWLTRCPSCGFQASTLAPHINDAALQDVDEVARADALVSLRRRNFETILHVLEQHRSDRGRLLDVGCAHGWFVEMAAQRGYEAIGLEPDRQIAAATRARGIEVHDGFFPVDIAGHERFDVISFNDVIEHIPGPDAVIDDVARLLGDGGLLVINIPLSSGVFYRVASLLARLGVRGPLDRMWQVGFPSPHVSYLTIQQVETMGRRSGLEPVVARRLRTLSVRGLWPRLRYDRSASIVSSGVVYVATLLMSPLMRLLPADIGLVVLRKAAPSAPPSGSTA